MKLFEKAVYYLWAVSVLFAIVIPTLLIAIGTIYVLYMWVHWAAAIFMAFLWLFIFSTIIITSLDDYKRI
jgi:hypothetical protein